ncbi:MAG: permease [Coriobacteriales bacterium]
MEALGSFLMEQVLKMQWLSDSLAALLLALGLDPRSQWGGTLHFFLYDTAKIVILLVVLIFVIGSLIHNWIPQEAVELVLGESNPLAVVLATLVGAPVYADTFGAVPIAEALYLKGAGLGTVLAFMMSVTTLSIPSLTMLSRVIKPRLMGTFIAVCMAGMIISGYVFNLLQPLL